MTLKKVVPLGGGKPLAKYSPGIKAISGVAVHTAGIVSADENFNTIHPNDIKEQTRQVLETIQGIIEGAGGTLDDVAFNHIFLKDLADWPAMNEVYGAFFTSDTPPARYVVQAGLVKPDWLIEIASVAYVDE